MNPAPTPTPQTDKLHALFVNDTKNDGTYTLNLNEEETAALFRRVGALERKLTSAQAALAAKDRRISDALKLVSTVADSLNSNDPKHKPHKSSIEVVCMALQAKEILSHE